MSNLAKYYELDPELAALYGEKQEVHEPEVLPKRKPITADEIPDPLLDLKAIAEKRHEQSRDRRELKGFDQVEHDLSNVLSVGWSFLTRGADE